MYTSYKVLITTHVFVCLVTSPGETKECLGTFILWRPPKRQDECRGAARKNEETSEGISAGTQENS